MKMGSGKFRRRCSVCGEPFEFEMGPNREIPDDVYYSNLKLSLRFQEWCGVEYWECQECFHRSNERTIE